MSGINSKLDQTVRLRSQFHCEYCLLPQAASRLTFPVDHIIARQHGGATSFENLALCCGRCNQHKGPNISGLDPQTGQMSRLYHPRNDRWEEHFRYEGAVLVGLTGLGRTTIAVLNVNHPGRVAVRSAWMDAGLFRQ